MNSFTVQQLSGGQRYGIKTKIGNWQEDRCYEECTAKETKDRSLRDRFEEKVRVCTAPTMHARRPKDGMVHFGSAISFLHVQTNGTLACDPFECMQCDNDDDDDDDDPNVVVASVCPSTSPMARNTFVLHPIDDDERHPDIGGGGRREGNGRNNHSGSDNGALHWGESFRIACFPSLVESARLLSSSGRIFGSASAAGDDADRPPEMLHRPLYLASRREALSDRPRIYLTSDGTSYGTRWAADAPAKSKDSGFVRFVNAGSPVPLDEHLVLRHLATGELLSVDVGCCAFVATDFGGECRVSVRARFECGRVGMLRDEFRGARTSATNCRPETIQNVWAATVLSRSDDGCDGDGGGDDEKDEHASLY